MADRAAETWMKATWLVPAMLWEEAVMRHGKGRRKWAAMRLVPPQSRRARHRGSIAPWAETVAVIEMVALFWKHW